MGFRALTISTGIICGVFVFIGCGTASDPPNVIDSQTPASAIAESIKSTFATRDFKLGIVDKKDECTVVYSRSGSGLETDSKRVDLGIGGPCEFIRRTDYQGPETYVIGRGKLEHNVLIITGGDADRQVTDPLQPGGCGTVLRRVLIFDTEIKLGEKISGNGPMCPSRGMDRNWFLE